MIDPKTLTPESLYILQSETWVQGAEAERKRIIDIIKNYGSEDFTAELIEMIEKDA